MLCSLPIGTVRLHSKAKEKIIRVVLSADIEGHDEDDELAPISTIYVPFDGSDSERLPAGVSTMAGIKWLLCRSVVSRSQETCFPGSWVFFHDAVRPQATAELDPNHVLLGTARILHILIPASVPKEASHHHPNTLVIVERFQVLNVKDVRTNMPILSRRQLEESSDSHVIAVHPKVRCCAQSYRYSASEILLQTSI